jgi:hypothetical protein
MRLLTIALLASAASAAFAEDRYTCSFSKGVVVSLDGSNWGTYSATAESSPMMFRFGTVSKAEAQAMLAQAKKAGNQKATATFSKFVEAATSTGHAGWVRGADGYQATVQVIRGAETTTFVETTASGNVMTTTVFIDARTLDGKLQSVHSRHVALTGGALTSQYTGGCLVEN